MDKLTYPDRIRAWVVREFSPDKVERVFTEILDVATGNRQGNRFCIMALSQIFPEGTPGRLKFRS